MLSSLNFLYILFKNNLEFFIKFKKLKKNKLTRMIDKLHKSLDQLIINLTEEKIVKI
jgi:DNA-directed RNA polymerase subunit F